MQPRPIGWTWWPPSGREGVVTAPRYVRGRRAGRRRRRAGPPSNEPTRHVCSPDPTRPTRNGRSPRRSL